MKKLTILLLFLTSLLLAGCMDGGQQEAGKDNGEEVSKKQNEQGEGKEKKQEKESGSGEKLVEKNEEEVKETEQNEKETEKEKTEEKEIGDSGEEEIESEKQIKEEKEGSSSAEWSSKENKELSGAGKPNPPIYKDIEWLNNLPAQKSPVKDINEIKAKVKNSQYLSDLYKNNAFYYLDGLKMLTLSDKDREDYMENINKEEKNYLKGLFVTSMLLLEGDGDEDYVDSWSQMSDKEQGKYNKFLEEIIEKTNKTIQYKKEIKEQMGEETEKDKALSFSLEKIVKPMFNGNCGSMFDYLHDMNEFSEEKIKKIKEKGCSPRVFKNQNNYSYENYLEAYRPKILNSSECKKDGWCKEFTKNFDLTSKDYVFLGFGRGEDYDTLEKISYENMYIIKPSGIDELFFIVRNKDKGWRIILENAIYNN